MNEWMGSYIYFIMVQNLSQNYQVELWVNKLGLINDSCLQMTLQFTAYSHIQTLIWPLHWPLWRLVRSARQMACMAWTRKYVIAWIINSAFLFRLLQHGLYLGGNWVFLLCISASISIFPHSNHWAWRCSLQCQMYLFEANHSEYLITVVMHHLAVLWYFAKMILRIIF